LKNSVEKGNGFFELKFTKINVNLREVKPIFSFNCQALEAKQIHFHQIEPKSLQARMGCVMPCLHFSPIEQYTSRQKQKNEIEYKK
jgi:hypothetical protein